MTRSKKRSSLHYYSAELNYADRVPRSTQLIQDKVEMQLFVAVGKDAGNRFKKH